MINDSQPRHNGRDPGCVVSSRGTYGRQRADKMIAGAIRPKEHPYCSFDRYNNLVGSRHVKL